jgi:hypothetical protein
MRTTFVLAALLAAGFAGMNRTDKVSYEPQIVTPCEPLAADSGAKVMCVLSPSPIKVEYLALAE